MRVLARFMKTDWSINLFSWQLLPVLFIVFSNIHLGFPTERRYGQAAHFGYFPIAISIRVDFGFRCGIDLGLLGAHAIIKANAGVRRTFPGWHDLNMILGNAIGRTDGKDRKSKKVERCPSTNAKRETRTRHHVKTNIIYSVFIFDNSYLHVVSHVYSNMIHWTFKESIL